MVNYISDTKGKAHVRNADDETGKPSLRSASIFWPTLCPFDGAVFRFFYLLFHLFSGPENRAFLAVALICLAYGVLKKARLRAELTDRRVIVKGGVLSRYETDMALSRIESIEVIKTFAERLTDGGTILLRGIGGTTLVLPVLKNFGEFREACERLRHEQPRS